LTVDGDSFRSHLQQAATDAQPLQKIDDEAARLETDEPREAKADQEETSTTHQEDTLVAAETNETTEEASAEETAAEDEVTLSAVIATAAAVLPAVEEAEAATSAIQVVSAEVTEEAAAGGQATTGGQTSTAEQQQPTRGELLTNVIETTDETETPTTTNPTTATATSLSGGETNHDVTSDTFSPQAASENTANLTNAPVASATPATNSTSEIAKATVANAKPPAISSTNERQQPATGGEAEGDSENDNAREKTRQAAPTLVSTKSDLAVPIDTELFASGDIAAAEPAAPASAPTGETTALRALDHTQANKSVDTTRGAGTSETPTVDRARFVQRVSGAIRTAQQRDGQIQLRLSPPELGTLRIQLTIQEGAITAHLETETASARTVLLDNLPALRERLAELNITIEKFDVDVGQENKQAPEDPGNDPGQAEQRNGDRDKQSRVPREQESSTIATAASSAESASNSGLDVRI